MKKLILLGGFLLACATTTFAQNGDNYWARLDKNHPVAPVDQVLDENATAPSLSADSQGTAGYRLTMTYDGQFRSLTNENKELIEEMGFGQRVVKDYKYELLFKYNNQDFWLPVPTELVEQLQIELRQNEPVLLYGLLLQDPKDKQVSKTLLVQDFKVSF